MTTKDCLHELIDRLPETAVAEAERVLEALGRDDRSGLPVSLRDAPLDDEPETEEERLAVQEAYEAIARGDVVPDEELERELGW